MKKLYIKAISALLIAGSTASCGDGFLDTDIYNGFDIEEGLTDIDRVQYALNGTYGRLYRYEFAGNYATSFGDIASDLSYWNMRTNHFTDAYRFTPTPNDTYLAYIWEYGYKVADNSARIIEAGKELVNTTEEERLEELDMYLAEAHALRAYGHFVLVNLFAHQVKVNGQDFSSTPGIVVIDKPKTKDEKVSRSTVGDAYTAIVNDLKESIRLFEEAGQDKGTSLYFNPAAAWGLLSRVYLYMENYDDAITAAQNALDAANNPSLAYTPSAYKALYNGETSNSESFFCLAISSIYNWSANSCGSLWSSYSYAPSAYLQSLMASDDVRRAVWSWTTDRQGVVWFDSGKFGAYGMGNNPAYGNNYLINAPEMYLNQAESYLKSSNPSITDAQNALLVVAKRNPNITTVADLPSDEAGLMSFIQNERARELFQEGHRLYDLRRWDVSANLYATDRTQIQWAITDFKISDCVYPIPDAEINAGFGVEQNEGWQSTFPQ